MSVGKRFGRYPAVRARQNALRLRLNGKLLIERRTAFVVFLRAPIARGQLFYFSHGDISIVKDL